MATIPSGSVILMPTLQVAAPPLSDTLRRLSRAAGDTEPGAPHAGPHPHRFASRCEAKAKPWGEDRRGGGPTTCGCPKGRRHWRRSAFGGCGRWWDGAVAGPAAPYREASEHPIILLIGPEGDFSKDEVAMAQAKGAQPVSLGSLTLRSETAAIAALAMVRYAFGCP